MSLFRKFFGSGEESSEEENHSEFNRSASDLSLPVDERFTFNFKKNGGKFLGLSTMWNDMANKIDADIYAMIGDDMVFSSPGWDVDIIREFTNGPKDKIKMVHCNDGMRGPGNKYETVKPFCVNFFIHKNYVNIAGYFVEPYLENIHQDTWIQTMFDRLGRSVYRHDILIKHLHQSESTNKSDAITDNLEKLRVGIWDNNNWIVEFRTQFEHEFNKLKSFIDTNA